MDDELGLFRSADRLKKCSICHERKQIDEFRKLKNGFSSHCKPCAAAYLREWRHKNVERLKAQRRDRYAAETSYEREYKRRHGRAAYAKDPDKFRDSRLRYQFGITLAEYREMEARQGGVCAICGGVCKTGRDLAVDHDHATGDVRALLCGKCNKGIGLFDEDPDLMLAAIAYLLSFQNVLEGSE